MAVSVVVPIEGKLGFDKSYIIINISYVHHIPVTKFNVYTHIKEL